MIHTYLQWRLCRIAVAAVDRRRHAVAAPKWHLQTVKGHNWMTDSQFADILPIYQTAPAEHPEVVRWSAMAQPDGRGSAGSIIGGLIHRAMIVGGALMYVVTRFWQKAQKAKWRAPSRRGRALTVGPSCHLGL